MQYSPLSSTFSSRDRHQGRTLVVSFDDAFTAVLIRIIFTVCLSVTAKRLADAAPCIDSESLTKMYMYQSHITPTDGECAIWAVADGTCQFQCRWSSFHSNLAPDTVRLLLDIPASPTVSQCTLCRQTARASPSIGNGTKPDAKRIKLTLYAQSLILSLEIHIYPHKNTCNVLRPKWWSQNHEFNIFFCIPQSYTTFH